MGGQYKRSLGDAEDLKRGLRDMTKDTERINIRERETYYDL